MKTPDISTIEKVLDNEATAEEAKWVVGWFKTEEGMKWLSERMDKDEKLYQALWKTYFKAIAIKERRNPRKQRQDMPVRYWKYLTEKCD